MKKLAVVLLLLGALVVTWMFLRQGGELGRDPKYARIEGTMRLTERQKSEVPSPKGTSVSINRYRDAQGIWQVSLGTPPEGARDVFSLGSLDSVPNEPDVSLPVYLCSWKISGETETRGLDLSKTCAGGKLQNDRPVGYQSKLIRGGFRLLVRCRTPEAGSYLSFNSSCENRHDRVEGLLGSMRVELSP